MYIYIYSPLFSFAACGCDFWGTAQEFLQLSATQLFDPASRTFRFFDAISE